MSGEGLACERTCMEPGTTGGRPIGDVGGGGARALAYMASMSAPGSGNGVGVVTGLGLKNFFILPVAISRWY